jgi:hypothetical protein
MMPRIPLQRQGWCKRHVDDPGYCQVWDNDRLIAVKRAAYSANSIGWNGTQPCIPAKPRRCVGA